MRIHEYADAFLFGSATIRMHASGDPLEIVIYQFKSIRLIIDDQNFGFHFWKLGVEGSGSVNLLGVFYPVAMPDVFAFMNVYSFFCNVLGVVGDTFEAFGNDHEAQ